MMKTLLVSCAILLLFTNSDCKKDIITPPTENTDTTSHNFVVTRIDTLGDVFSFANGVDIVDENNIWAAGIFTERDTNNEILYNKNLAHWNGEKWEFIDVPMMGYNNTGPSIEELGGVKVFNDSSIFVVAQHDNSVAWRVKNTWTTNYVNDAAVSRIFWARSKSEIYFVAREGRATYYNGKTFTKVSTGLTNPPLLDVWGDEEAVYAVGTGDSPSTGADAVFLYGNQITWDIIAKYDVKNNNSVGVMSSIFRASKTSKILLLGGNLRWQLFKIENLSPFSSKLFFDFPVDYGAYTIRGTADNDLYVSHQRSAGFFHYNGKTWYRYESSIQFILFQFAVKKNIWIATSAASNGGIGTAIIMTENTFN